MRRTMLILGLALVAMLAHWDHTPRTIPDRPGWGCEARLVDGHWLWSAGCTHGEAKP